MGSDHTRLMALFDAFCDAEPAAQRAELARLRAAADPLAEPLAAMLQADEDTSALDHGIAVPGGPALPERYRLVDRIGQGGMGLVFRVLDAVLHRTVALKVVAHTAPEHVARFLAEARVVAQLQHPGIVPVHDLGTLPDGHPFFTMPEIQGQTWAALLRQWRPEPAWRRDAVYVLRQVAQAVAFAHEQGVVHRDLKPANVMVGAHGEVVVLDWGLARPLPDTRLRAMEGRQPTAAGMVMGTPGFMAPEQALGAVDQVGKPSDVYALGAMLHVVLTGRAPSGFGPPTLAPDLPAALTTLCAAALSILTEQRPPDAQAVASALSDWLSGAADQAWALDVLTRAQADHDGAEAARIEAAARQAELTLQQAALPPGAPAEAKVALWALEDEVAGLLRRARTLEARWLRQVHTALGRAPDLEPAHLALADHHRAAAEAAEARGDADDAALHREAVAAHDRGRHSGWLAGKTRLSVHSHPSGVPVGLARWTLNGRVRTLGAVTPLGITPVQAVVEAGPAVLVFEPTAGPAVRLPVTLARGASHRARLTPGPPPPPGTCHVPAGLFDAGGDPEAPDSFPATPVRIGGFILAADPVTNREYIEFLDDLVATGRADEAALWAPAEPAGGAQGPVYGRTAGGRFTVRTDAEGVPWALDEPVVQITWHAAMAYARWRSRRDGLPWRLPHELEWEKAARGADRRPWPWGDRFDPALARCLGHVAGPPRRAPVGTPATDESPYGVRGLGGNVRDWCLNVWKAEPPPATLVVNTPDPGDEGMRAARGGSFVSLAPMCRAATRFGAPPDHRASSVGFRLACDWPPPATFSRPP